MSIQNQPRDEKDGFIYTPPETDKPYLGDLDNVRTLVAGFANEVAEAYSAYLAGDPDARNALEQIGVMCREHGDTIMGRDEEIEVAPWQNPSHLGASLRRAAKLPIDADPGEAYFRFLALQVIKGCKAVNDGMSPIEAGPRLQEILDDAVQRILGVAE